MQSSENIVAINKDANAPIFEFSDLGSSATSTEILPKLTEGHQGEEGLVGNVRHNGHRAPQHRANLPPQVDPLQEFVKRKLDSEDDRIEVGVVIVGGVRPACLREPPAAAARGRSRDDGAPRRGAVAVIEKAKTCGGHNLSGAVMRPGPLQELFPELSREDWRNERFAFGEVTKEAVYVLERQVQAAHPDAPAVQEPRQRDRVGGGAARYQQRQREGGPTC